MCVILSWLTYLEWYCEEKSIIEEKDCSYVYINLVAPHISQGTEIMFFVLIMKENKSVIDNEIFALFSCDSTAVMCLKINSFQSTVKTLVIS